MVKMVNGQVNTMIPNDWGQANCSILLGEVKDMVRKLRSYGVQMADIAAVLHEDDPMPELVTKKFYFPVTRSHAARKSAGTGASNFNFFPVKG